MSTPYPFMAEVTFRVTFRDKLGNLHDPDNVEFRLGTGIVATYDGGAGDVERESTGIYKYVWIADSPGDHKRVWRGWSGTGQATTFYAESGGRVIEVYKSEFS